MNDRPKTALAALATASLLGAATAATASAPATPGQAERAATVAPAPADAVQFAVRQEEKRKYGAVMPALDTRSGAEQRRLVAAALERLARNG